MKPLKNFQILKYIFIHIYVIYEIVNALPVKPIAILEFNLIINFELSNLSMQNRH